MLFGALNANIFMLFAGENRFLYEEVLTRIPFYVIIGAALASIYHGTKRTDDKRGLGLAVFDEAFSKMDGQNQRTMLQCESAQGPDADRRCKPLKPQWSVGQFVVPFHTLAR